MEITTESLSFLMLAILFLALSNIVLNRDTEAFQNMIDSFHLNKNKMKRNVRQSIDDTTAYVSANVRARMKTLGF
tara:strand:- start:441 stop:665 length:225 start_codon:yes stop_codon:yes gene_type:complete